MCVVGHVFSILRPLDRLLLLENKIFLIKHPKPGPNYSTKNSFFFKYFKIDKVYRQTAVTTVFQ